MVENNISIDFRRRLEQARRLLTGRLLRESFRDSWFGASCLLLLGAIVWLILALYHSKYISIFYVSVLLLLPPLAAALIITIYKILQRWPGLAEVAERLDIKNKSSNAIATAWELLQNPVTEDSSFGRFTVERGYVALQANLSSVPVYDGFSRQHTLVAVNLILALVVTLLAFSLSARQELCERNTEQLTDAAITCITPAARIPERHSDDVPAKPVSVVPANVAADAAALYKPSPQPDSGTASGSDAGQRATGANQQTGAAGSSSASQPKHPSSNRRNVGENRNRQSEKGAQLPNQSSGSGDSASGSSGMKNSQSGLAIQNLSLSGSADNHDNSDDEDKADAQGKPSIYSSRGGIKPLSPDSSEKPGRELGKNDPKGNKPGTARGGPTGDKKSRGTASLISGATLPDVVSGKLSKGFDITNLEHIPALREPSESVVLPQPIVTAAAEPAVSLTQTPPELRETVKNYLIKLHQYDNQQQENKYGTDNTVNH
ncbi:MAG: hypothetical protein WCI51_06365 [Lentisphaerota bacterium]